MASSFDYFIAGDHNSGKIRVGDHLTALGYEVATDEQGRYVASRGSLQKTVWLGAMAGKNFHVSFTVEFMVDQQGQLVARLNRNMGGGALKGGALGAAKVDSAFVEAANALSNGLATDGILVGSASH